MKRKRIHRGGRPRNNKSAVDLGTPELVEKRLALSKTDPTLSSCPLDVAFAKKFITLAQKDAAEHFLACRAIKHGSPHPRAVDCSRVSFGESEKVNPGAEAAYQEACEALKRQSRSTLDAILNVLVYQCYPEWLVDVMKPAEVDHLQARARVSCTHFLNGMDVLHVWHTGMKSRAA